MVKIVFKHCDALQMVAPVAKGGQLRARLPQRYILKINFLLIERAKDFEMVCNVFDASSFVCKDPVPEK